MASKLFNPLHTMRIRDDAGLRSAVGATFGKVRGAKVHQGWDLYAPSGTPIYAIGDGYVVWKANHGAYGQQVLLQFNMDGDNSYCSTAQTRYAFYAHLSLISVNAGDRVKAGQQIGATGTTGNAEKRYPHLHFEIRTTPKPLGVGLVGRENPGDVLGYQLLSCRSNAHPDDGIDTVDLVCRAPVGPTEIGSPDAQ